MWCWYSLAPEKIDFVKVMQLLSNCLRCFLESTPFFQKKTSRETDVKRNLAACHCVQKAMGDTKIERTGRMTVKHHDSFDFIFLHVICFQSARVRLFAWRGLVRFDKGFDTLANTVSPLSVVHVPVGFAPGR